MSGGCSMAKTSEKEPRPQPAQGASLKASAATCQMRNRPATSPSDRDDIFAKKALPAISKSTEVAKSAATIVQPRAGRDGQRPRISNRQSTSALNTVATNPEREAERSNPP